MFTKKKSLRNRIKSKDFARLWFLFFKYFYNFSFKIWIIIIKKNSRLDAWDYFCITGLWGGIKQGGIKSSSGTNEGPALIWKY